MRHHASHPSSETFSPLQPLLFWETCILLFASGILGVRFPLPALVVTGLILLTDSRLRKLPCLLLALICIGTGLLYGQATLPGTPPDPPVWLAQKLEQPRGRAIRVTGTVDDIKGLPDQRLRIVLKNVHPEPDTNHRRSGLSEEHLSGKPLPGLLAWTWEQPSFRPLPGQTVTTTLNIRPVHGFHNGNSTGSEDYWYRQDIYFQSWSRGERYPVILSGQADFSAALREYLRQRVVAAIFPEPLALTGENSASDPVSSAESLRQPKETNSLSSQTVSRGWAIIPALLFGDRFYLQTQEMERINAAGLGHSLALSGQHLAVTGLIALLFVTSVGIIRPSVFIHIPAQALTGLLALPPAVFYLWLGNAPPSLIRAALMLFAWCAFRCLPSCIPARFSPSHRQLAFPDALILAFLCMLILDPNLLYDTGAQLSFTAVAGITLCSPFFSYIWKRTALSKISPYEPASFSRRLSTTTLRVFWLTLGCSIAAQLATLPLVLDTFGFTTLWFPLNLLWLPVLGFFVLPTAFAGLLFLIPDIPEMGNFLMSLAIVPCNWLLDGLVWLQENAGLDSLWLPTPHWTALPGFAAIAVALSLLPGRSTLPAAGKLLLFAGCLLLLIGPLQYLKEQRNKDTVLRVLDVGQAQAILLEWPRQNGRGRALIDGGGFFSERFDSGRDIITPVLVQNHPMTLDFIALSHPDRDHLRGLLFIAEHFTCEKIYTTRLAGIDSQASKNKNTNPLVSLSKVTSRSEPNPLTREFISILERRAIPRHTLSAGQRIHLNEELWLEVLAPPPEEIPKGNNGLILRLVFRGKGLVLLPGDAGASYLRALLRTGTDLSAEVLVIPHHGSKGSLVPALFDTSAPDMALVSSGAYNSFGHPASAVRKALQDRGIPLHVTAEEGELVVRWSPDGNRQYASSLSREQSGLSQLLPDIKFF